RKKKSPAATWQWLSILVAWSRRASWVSALSSPRLFWAASSPRFFPGEGLKRNLKNFFLPLICFFALAPEHAWARGGGGCLAAGTPILTPHGPIPIERLRPGDAIWTIGDGQLHPGIVQAPIAAAVHEFLQLSLAGRSRQST